jgi:hypothetical protein
MIPTAAFSTFDLIPIAAMRQGKELKMLWPLTLTHD